MGIIYELRDVDDQVLYVGQTSPNPGYRLTHHVRYQPWSREIRSMHFALVDVDPASINLAEMRHAAERLPKYGNWSGTPESQPAAVLMPMERRLRDVSPRLNVCPAAMRLIAMRSRRSLVELATIGAIPMDWVRRVRLGENFAVPIVEARVAAARLDLPESELTCATGAYS